MNTHEPFTILSAERADEDSRVNVMRTGGLRAALRSRGFDFKEVRGCYDGAQEHSFLVLGQPEACQYLARFFGQESILHVDANRYARLQYLDGNAPQPLGLWREVSEREVLMHDAFTYDPATGRYYVCY